MFCDQCPKSEPVRYETWCFSVLSALSNFQSPAQSAIFEYNVLHLWRHGWFQHSASVWKASDMLHAQGVLHVCLLSYHCAWTINRKYIQCRTRCHDLSFDRSKEKNWNGNHFLMKTIGGLPINMGTQWMKLKSLGAKKVKKVVFRLQWTNLTKHE